MTAATALILARVFGNSPDFRLNVQRRSDLWAAMHSPRERARIKRARCQRAYISAPRVAVHAPVLASRPTGKPFRFARVSGGWPQLLDPGYGWTPAEKAWDSLSAVNLEFVVVRLGSSSRAKLRRCLEEVTPTRGVSMIASLHPRLHANPEGRR